MDPLTQARRIAITGAGTHLGSALLAELAADPRCSLALALDVDPPRVPVSGTVRFERVDLTAPTAHRRLGQLIRDHNIDTVVHGAFLELPSRVASWAHELEEVGTAHILDACAATEVTRLVQISTTWVYGAHRDNPGYILEDQSISACGTDFMADKRRADLAFAAFADEHPGRAVARLRFAAMLGHQVTSPFARLLRSPVAPSILGHDPLVQFVHFVDAVRALELSVMADEPVRGAVNIVGRGVLPYSTVLALLGRLPLPLPDGLARSVMGLGWRTRLSWLPPALAHFLRYPCVADGARAASLLGFRAQFDQAQTILDFAGLSIEEGGLALAALGAA